MTPLMLYWAACVIVCVAAVAGTVSRQVWLRRQQRRAMVDHTDDVSPRRPWMRLTAGHSVWLPRTEERRGGGDRRRGDRRAREQPHA
jgi:hypothetical protein